MDKHKARGGEGRGGRTGHRDIQLDQFDPCLVAGRGQRTPGMNLRSMRDVGPHAHRGRADVCWSEAGVMRRMAVTALFFFTDQGQFAGTDTTLSVGNSLST